MKKFFQKSALTTVIALAGSICIPGIGMADGITDINMIVAANSAQILPLPDAIKLVDNEEANQQLLRDHQMTPTYQAARDYWTIERIESAIPVELPQADGSSVRILLDAEDFAGDWTAERIASLGALEVLSPDGFVSMSHRGLPAAFEEQRLQTLEEYLLDTVGRVAPDSLVRFWRTPEGFDPTIRDGGSARAPVWTPELGEVDLDQYTLEELAQIVRDYWTPERMREVWRAPPKEWVIDGPDGIRIQLL